jgi:hypothetical protein
MPSVTELLGQIKNLGPEGKKGLCKDVFGELKGKDVDDFAGHIFREMPSTNLKNAVVSAAANLPEKEKKEALKEIQQGGLPAPGEKTRDRLWLVVVSAFAFVLAGSFISIATAMFITVP